MFIFFNSLQKKSVIIRKMKDRVLRTEWDHLLEIAKMLGTVQRGHMSKVQEEASERTGGRSMGIFWVLLPDLSGKNIKPGSKDTLTAHTSVSLAKGSLREWPRHSLNSLTRKDHSAENYTDLTTWRCPAKQTCPQEGRCRSGSLGLDTGTSQKDSSGRAAQAWIMWPEPPVTAVCPQCHASLSTFSSQPG